MDKVMIKTSNKTLNFFVINISVLILFSAMSWLASGDHIEEPIIISQPPGKQFVVWEFDNTSNYLTNNTVIEGGTVQLQKISSTWYQASVSDFNNGSTKNITITGDSNLQLSTVSDDLIIDVNTEREKAFKINDEHIGYQTFRVANSVTISKLTFLVEIDDEVSKNLNISIETIDGEILDHESIPPTEFFNDINTITANFNCTINANTTYRIAFESSEKEGCYKLIGDSNSDFSYGNFQKVNRNEEEVNKNEKQEENEVESEVIEFEIYTMNYSSEGKFESEVFNAGSSVFWDKITWNSILHSDADIKLEVRSGNSSNLQDNSWTAWMNIPITGSRDSDLVFKVPPSICFQYRVSLSTTNIFQTPIFEWINISYERFVDTGSIETLDFEAIESEHRPNFTAFGDSKGQVTEFYYSLDSGKLWIPLYGNDSLNLSKQTTKIRFLVKFITKNTIITPRLDNISLEFSLYDPYSNKDDNKPPSSPPSSKPIALPPGPLVTAGISLGIISLLGYGIGTETGKYTFLKGMLFFVIPLYHKVDRDKILDHYLRNQIYKYIKANPGTHYSEIMKDTGVKNGVLVHHLNTLNREGFIKSTRDGMFRRFYPTGMKIPEKEINSLSWFQIQIFNFIRTHPGTSPGNIADEIGKSKQVINYHLNLMKSSKLIRTENQGRYTQIYITYNELDNLPKL